MMNDTGHDSVLLHEAIAALQIKATGCYVDATFGRGGHTRKMLEELAMDGRVFASDKDPTAIAFGQQAFADDARLRLWHMGFNALKPALEAEQLLGEIDGLLFDLGVSSPQLDQAERGFSFAKTGPLDMRMNPTAGQPVSEWLADIAESDLAHIIKSYGEERFAKRVARAIKHRLETQAITTTTELADIVSGAVPTREPGKHPATRTFQALRIAVNGELTELTEALQDALALLKPGGRLVVVSFHSLEDRIVKRFFREQAAGDPYPKSLPVTQDALNPKLKIIGKALKPSEQEIQHNVRARSAVMRVAEKLS